MPRISKRTRSLAVDGETYLWSLGGGRPAEPGRPAPARLVLTIRRLGARGRVLVVFEEGPDRLIPDGWVPSGAVGTAGAWLNLHEPGTVRALLDAALAGGWQPDDPAPEELDGWPLLAPVAGRRA
ncbi:hypothetical protein [Kitasatospora sp. GAS204B]|uniref:hypothetical protein n=1 Tax=unclassified Kitasatospora TaxID=2633591 RepID=UPI00247517E8|nr:hypothetical protein [Kitasatospora sp. GAS204B]